MRFCCAILISVWSSNKGTIQRRKQRAWQISCRNYGLRAGLPLVSPKFLHIRLWVGGWPLIWVTKSKDVGVIVCTFSFQDFQPTVCGSDPPTSQTDGQKDRQTDGQTTCDHKTALCTIVHRAVKTIGPDSNHRLYTYTMSTKLHSRYLNLQ